MDKIIEKLMEKLQAWLNRMYRMNSRNIKTLQIKKCEKTQKQLNELREDFNKLQSETKETIKN
jgi:ferritin-like metal-binding protein YciE